MNVGIVILNYFAYETTIECVKSFKRVMNENVKLKIVIVDNASPNNSYEILNKQYKNDDLVSVYGVKSNVGFAKGNNYGYKKLMETMECDYVIISNDDIIIEQDGLFEWMDRCYKRYKFSVLGPDIYSVNGKFHQSPAKVLSRSELKCICIDLYNRINKLGYQIRKLFHLSIKQQMFNVWKNPYFREFQDNKTLHGSFQIFSKDYFRCYDEPYHPETFLYMEEDLLKLRCDKAGLKMCYEPSYSVKHLQAMSSALDDKNALDKQIFRMKCVEQSMKVYLKELRKYNKRGKRRD